MKCQNCDRNEAELTISAQYKDHHWDLHLCEECAGSIQRFLDAAGTEYQRKLTEEGREREIPAMMTASSLFSQARNGGALSRHRVISTIPEDAGEEIRIRRKKNQLETLLAEAISKEAYEEAAELRDSLNQLKMGV